jgi:ADP-heptose:LPS heptosyltransferase
MSAATGRVQRILLITLSNIGDALMTTPVMQALHTRHPGARLDIVIDPRSGELFTHCPYRGALIARDKRLGWRGRLAQLRRLRATRYDLVVDLRTDGLAWLLRTRHRLSRWGQARSGMHAVERHMGVIAGREYHGGIPPLQLWLSGAEQSFARDTLAGLPGPRRLALGPGARWEPKRWPAHRFRELAACLRNEYDALVLLGDRTDSACCREIAARAPLPSLDLAGQATLLQSAAVLGHMRLFVGNDSGLGHLAAAAGIPTLTLFGPGDPARYRPWNPRGRWLQSPTRQLADLTVADAAQAARSLLEETSRSATT